MYIHGRTVESVTKRTAPKRGKKEMPFRKPPTLSVPANGNMFERHHQIARLLLLGLPQNKVAEVVGVSPTTITNLKSSPVFQHKMALLRARADDQALDVSAEFLKDAHRSYKLLKSVRDGELSKDVPLRVRVAQDLLDRAGHSRIQKIEGRHAIAHLDGEAIEQIKRRAQEIREARANSGFSEVEVDAAT